MIARLEFELTYYDSAVQHLYNSSLSSSCRAARTDLPDPLSPPVSIVHRSREVFKAIYCIGTELLNIGSSWSFCLCSSMWKSLQEYITCGFVLTSPAASRMSGSSNLYSFCDGWYYLPTPSLGQDMTQGQFFFKWSLTGLNSEFFLLPDELPHQGWRT